MSVFAYECANLLYDKVVDYLVPDEWLRFMVRNLLIRHDSELLTADGKLHDRITVLFTLLNAT